MLNKIQFQSTVSVRVHVQPWYCTPVAERVKGHAQSRAQQWQLGSTGAILVSTLKDMIWEQCWVLLVEIQPISCCFLWYSVLLFSQVQSLIMSLSVVQVLMCGSTFLVLFMGNFFTTLGVVYQKYTNQEKAKEL